MSRRTGCLPCGKAGRILKQTDNNDLPIYIYGRQVGLFDGEAAYVAIPWPMSLWKRCREVRVPYEQIRRISMMQSNSDLSIYLTTDSGGGKQTGYTINLGIDLPRAVVMFEHAVSLVRQKNRDAQVYLPPALVKKLEGRTCCTK